MSQLLVCFGGDGLVWLDNDWHLCSSGRAYVSPPGVPHAYRALPAEPWMLCWVQYAADGPSGGVTGAAQPVLVSVDAAALITAIEGLHRESMGPAEPGVLHHWASLVHAHARRAIAPPARLASLWAAVRADLRHPWTTAELATSAGVSSEHLRRLSQHEVGRSPMRHVTELRMRQAIALLASESYTVEQVAERVGYENAFAFSTAFKRCAGLAPSRFRGNNKR